MIPFSNKMKHIMFRVLVGRSKMLILLMSLCLTGSLSLRMPTKYANGCYGGGIQGQDYLSPDCNIGELIVIGYFKVGAKQQSSGCPKSPVGIVNDTQKCCTYNANSQDKYCFFDYTISQSPTAKSVEYWASICVGRSRCWSPNDNFGIRVEQMSTFNKCNQLDFYDYTHYATAEFYCIDDAKRLPDQFGSTETRTADSVILSSSDYQETRQTIIAEDTCSLNVVCGDVIVVTLLDVRLNESTSQHVSIRDGAHTSTIDNRQNTLFVVTNAFHVSNSNFMRIEVRNPDTLQGKFAILFESLHGNDVTISCGSSALASYTECTTTTPTQTGTGGPGNSSPQTTVPGGSNSHQDGDQVSVSDKPFLGPFIVFLLLFLLVVCVLVVAIWQKWWSKQWWPWRSETGMDPKVAPTGPQTKIQQNSNYSTQNEITPVESPNAGSGRLPPLLPQQNIEVDEGQHQRESKKKKKKHRRREQGNNLNVPDKDQDQDQDQGHRSRENEAVTEYHTDDVDV